MWQTILIWGLGGVIVLTLITLAVVVYVFAKILGFITGVADDIRRSRP